MKRDMKYPSWWNKTVTLFCKYIDTENKKVVWYRYVLDNVFFGAKENKSVSDTDFKKSVSMICRIPESEAYRAYGEWESLDKEKFFTLKTGDVIILGNVSISVDESISGNRMNDVMKRYAPNCFEVNAFAYNDNAVLKHLKAEGRAYEY